MSKERRTQIVQETIEGYCQGNFHLEFELDNFPSMIKKIDKVYEEYAQTQWVSVKDRLPMKDQRILLYGKGDRQLTSIFKDGSFLYYTDESLEECNYVTHWQPLPEPPKQD